MTKCGGFIVELTLREVPFLDELVYLVKGRASGLSEDLGVSGRCAVFVRPHFGPGGRAYVAQIDVSADGARACVQAADADLFTAIEAAFTAARGALAAPSWPTPVDEAHDGWQPVRRRIAIT